MTEITRHRIVVASTAWADNTGEAMIAFDEVCRGFGAIPSGVTFHINDTVHAAIFHAIGNDSTLWNVKYEMERRFPDSVVALDPDDITNVEDLLSKAVPVDAIFSQVGGKYM